MVKMPLRDRRDDTEKEMCRVGWPESEEIGACGGVLDHICCLSASIM